MPSPRDPPRAASSFAAILVRVLRFGALAAAAGIALFCVMLLLVRYVVFPRVEDWRDDLTTALSEQLRQPVEIDRLATGWDGWNPKLVVYGFRVRSSAAGAAAAPLLELPEVSLIVAWTSLPALDLRLKEFVIEGPRLAVRRDRDGRLRVGGVEFDPEKASDDAPIVDWLFRQPHVAVHDALITWNDDQRNAPQLVLEHVHFRLESRFGRHRFGLRGTPPAEIASPIDVRGDLRGIRSAAWQEVEGEIYARFDYADIAGWSEWLPMPAHIGSGKGALRVWIELGKGKPKEIVADLALEGVKGRVEPGLPQLDLAQLSGRIGWRLAPPRREYYARNLAFATADGQRFDSTDVAVTLREAAGGAAATNLVEFDRLELGPLSNVAAHLPIPEAVRAALAAYAPRGTLSKGRILWEGSIDSLGAYNAAAEFADLGVAAQGDFPGLQGLSGRVEMTQAAGDLTLVSRGAVIELPSALPVALPLDRLNAAVSWENRAGRTSIRLEQAEFATGGTTGRANGVYNTAARGPGSIDLNAQLNQVSVAQVKQHLPAKLGPAVRAWLEGALNGGTASDVKVKVAGNLADFPFAGGKGGRFTVAARVKDGVLDYADGWPALAELDADLRVDGTRFSVDATKGRIAGVPLGKFKVEIDDLRAENPVLKLDGAGTFATSDVLHFIEASPVSAWIDHYTAGAKATGNGRLDLKLALPLRAFEGSQVAGEYAMTGNELKLAGAPLLSQVNGTLRFSEKGIAARDIAVDLLGGTAKLGIASDRAEVRVTGGGTTSIAALRREFGAPLADAVSGTVEWSVAAAIGATTTWTLESSLLGTAIDLPAPIGKTAGESMALKVERHGSATNPQEDTLTVTYGKVGRMLLHRKLAASGDTVDRALFLLGRAVEASPGARPERPGLWVRGELPLLNLDDWLAVRRRLAASGGATPAAMAQEGFELNGVDLDVAVLEGFSRRFNDMRVAARRAKEEWRLDLRAKELAGTAAWSMPSAGTPNGRIAARLARLVPPEPAELPPWKGVPAPSATKVEAGADNPWPEIDVRSEAFFVRGRDVGQLEFVAHPRGTEWSIDKLALVNEGGRLDATGRWVSAGREQQTRLDVALAVGDAGTFLNRLGYGDALHRAPTKISGNLAWAGGPSDFDYPSLSGAFRVEVGPGQFTKIDPGIGKLLGVLSLQSLPRRITLDFTDVFSEGFAFDEITGDVSVKSGVLTTSNLKILGPAAKVEISGDADLARETQQLSVRVLPALSTQISAGAALLFLANPIVGAAIGAGSLLAQKALSDPIEKLFSYDYRITGSWTDPVVTGGQAPPQPPEVRGR